MSLDRDEVYQKLSDIVVERLHVEKSSVNEEVTFDSLGADSLSRVEIMLDIEETFGLQISDEDAESIEKLQDAVEYIMQVQG